MEMWRWQHFRFDQNILNTIKKSEIFKNKKKLLKEIKIINAYSFIFKILIIYILIITPSYAYLDPGTGSIIVQALVAGFLC